jgi:hypothetical protein
VAALRKVQLEGIRVFVASVAILAVSGGAWPQTTEDWRWAKVDTMGRDGHYTALLEMVKGDGVLLPELKPDNARRFLLLGIAGLRQLRVEIFDALRLGKPLPSATLTALDEAKTRLMEAKARFKDDSDTSIGANRDLAEKSLDGYLLIINRIGSEHTRLIATTASLSRNDVADIVSSELETSLKSGGLHDILLENQEAQQQIERSREAVAAEQERVAQARAALNRMKATFSDASAHVQDVAGITRNEQEEPLKNSGLKDKTDTIAQDLQSKLLADSSSLCEPPVDNAAQAANNDYAAFRFLCSRAPAVAAAKRKADAVASSTSDRSPDERARAALAGVLEYVTSPEFIDDRTAPQLQQMLKRLKERP